MGCFYYPTVKESSDAAGGLVASVSAALVLASGAALAVGAVIATNGNDASGLAGPDTLLGEESSDQIQGGAGPDVLDCGPGKDLFDAAPSDKVRAIAR